MYSPPNYFSINYAFSNKVRFIKLKELNFCQSLSQVHSHLLESLWIHLHFSRSFPFPLILFLHAIQVNQVLFILQKETLCLHLALDWAVFKIWIVRQDQTLILISFRFKLRIEMVSLKQILLLNVNLVQHLLMSSLLKTNTL